MKKPSTTTGFIRKGLELFKKDFPEHYDKTVNLFEKIPGIYSVNTDKFAVTVRAGAIYIAGVKSVKSPRVRAQFTHEAVIAVVDGTDTLHNLLVQEQFILFADAEALLILSESIKLVILSAIWSSSLQSHFEDYRKWVYQQNGKQN